VQSTKASVDNLNLLAQGRGEVAFALGDSVALAWAGNAEAGFPQRLEGLRAIAAIYPNYVQIGADAQPGIVTLEDLPGKSMSVGEGLPPGFGSGISGSIALGTAIAFALFTLWTAAYGTLPSQVVRAMRVGFLLLLTFGLVANLVAKTAPAKAFFWALGVAGFLTGIYNWVF
jgi:hypothetical protein